MTDITPLHRAAMQVFAREGFEGASMRAIALAAGMRASSLYAHFKNKDDLYRQLVTLAYAAERKYLDKQFSEVKPSNAQEKIFGYLRAMAHHFQDNEVAQFILSFKFFPPQQHRNVIDEAVRGHDDHMLALLEKTYELCGKCRLTPRQFAHVFVALAESMECELFFACDSRLEERRCAAEAFLKLAFTT